MPLLGSFGASASRAFGLQAGSANKIPFGYLIVAGGGA